MIKTTNQPADLKRSITIAAFCFVAWSLLAVTMFVMLINEGFDQIILTQPILFFSILAASVFLLATTINHLIRYFQIKAN